jgi:hypothetical protein
MAAADQVEARFDEVLDAFAGASETSSPAWVDEVLGDEKEKPPDGQA